MSQASSAVGYEVRGALGPGPGPGQRFEGYRNRLVHDWAKTLAALGFVLVPLFVVLDYFTMPGALLSQFARYRATGVVFALAQFIVIRQSSPRSLSVLHGYAFTLMIGGMIARMTVDLGGFDSSYYAGLCLVVVAVNLVLPWQAFHSAINGALVVAMYVVANLVWGGPFRTASVINNLYFLSSTVVITVAISYLRHSLIEQEFRLRTQLLDANVSLDASRRELKEARDALWGEMEMAKRIQTALLPEDRRLNGFDVVATMHPAAEVGGDYYELIETDAGEHWVAIGDVSGHGVEAGLVMMIAQASILTAVNDRPGRPPSEVFRTVNRVLREDIARLGTTRYMTLNVIRLLPDRLVLAGKHLDLFIHRKRTGKVETICNDGSWIGVIGNEHLLVSDLELAIEEGDTVLLYTDGLTEAVDATGEMFGEERVEKVFAENAALPLEGLRQAIVDAAERFRSEQSDDVTVMLLRRTELN